MAYRITSECLNCAFCHNECPVDAIAFNGIHYEIDQGKCIGCGTCERTCNIRAIEDTDHPTPAPVPHEKRGIDCDLLVIGGGSSGLIAAVRAAEKSGKKVVVLESRKNTGGTGAYALALRVFDSKWEKDAGEPSRVDDYIRGAMNNTLWELDPQLVAACFHALPRFFDWLCEWAPTHDIWQLTSDYLSPVIDNVDMGDRKMVETKDFRIKAGPFIGAQMRKKCEELGVTVLTQHTAKEFLKDERGLLCGVLADDPGGETEVRFKACLAATGGLMKSELLTRVYPQFKDVEYPNYAHAYETNTGAGPLMAERAGIPLDLDNIAVAPVAACPLPFDEEVYLQGHRSDAIKVNLNGERWVNETVTEEMHFIRLTNQPKMSAYTIMDAEILTSPRIAPPRYLVDPMGGKNILASLPKVPNGEPGMPFPDRTGIAHFAITRGEKTPATVEAMRKLAELPGNHVVVADTIEELAGKIGVDPAKLKATVDHYNACCDRGEDDEFFKQPLYLKPIRKGPFIAIRSFLYTDGAFGGFYINSSMQVTDGKKPVPRLWASGDCTSGRFFMAHGERREITNDYSWAVASGFIAGESIAEYLNSSAE